MDDGTAQLNQTQQSVSTGKGYSWQASEYMHHHKPTAWYIVFFLIAVATTGLVYFLLEGDIFAAIVVALMFIALFVYAVRKPEILQYSVGEDGVTVGEKHYTYDKFRSFSVLQNTNIPSILLEPLQRFSLPVTMYCSPEDADKVVAVLSEYLPRGEKQQDIIDRLSHYLRF